MVNNKPLFIFEMANNHMGDINHGINLIHAIKEATTSFSNFEFAFKFQYRHLDTFIHPDFQNRTDIKYVKRFQETKLSAEQFMTLKNEIEKVGFITVCTPFDENSVEQVAAHKYSFLKIASCSLTDWPLLEKIAKTNLPIIASTAGSSFEEVDRVVSFFTHRSKDLTIMHCVAAYPTRNDNLQLNQIDLLKARYPEVKVGYSTHESPNNFSAIQLAVAKGATVFEKHVGLKTDKYAVNDYSATPEQVFNWLKAAQEAFEMCGTQGKRYAFSTQETADLRSLRRGAFANIDIKKGEKIDFSKVMLAIPSIENQVQANDMSKYREFYAECDIKKNEPILSKNVTSVDKREKVYEIVQKVKTLLQDAKVVVGNRLDFEVSHHYGIEKFYQYGATIINYINREYCKKIIAVLPGQVHPEQYHKVKEETFHVLYGEVEMTLDGRLHVMKTGDIMTIERGQKHSFTTKVGAVIEEISSTHYGSDSFYIDDAINKSSNRKTSLTYWVN